MLKVNHVLKCLAKLGPNFFASQVPNLTEVVDNTFFHPNTLSIFIKPVTWVGAGTVF